MTRLSGFRSVIRQLLPKRIADTLWYAAQRIGYPPDFSSEDTFRHERVAPFTMTGPERVYTLAESVKYIVRNKIAGAIVECGVWRGGSMMVVASTLVELGQTDRDLYLFDTYEGMTAPTEKDVSVLGRTAQSLMSTVRRKPDNSVWAWATLEDVRANIESTGYPSERVHYIKGPVEKTLPEQAPEHIALLRLDTDWYESTRHELEHLYPRLAMSGTLILDDYGFWQGARRACDEYFAALERAPLLCRIDDTGRVCVKV